MVPFSIIFVGEFCVTIYSPFNLKGKIFVCKRSINCKTTFKITSEPGADYAASYIE